MAMDQSMSMLMQQLMNAIDQLREEIGRNKRDSDSNVNAQFAAFKEELNKSLALVHERIDSKLDTKDFEPYRSFFKKANRLILSTLILARLALLFVGKAG